MDVKLQGQPKKFIQKPPQAPAVATVPYNHPERKFKFKVQMPGNIAKSVAHGIWYFFFRWIWQITSFILLLLLYMSYNLLMRVTNLFFIPSALRSVLQAPIKKIYTVLTANRNEERTITRLNLIELAMRNMMAKKSRAIITVGGMAIGIAAIVFLVSIGFGLQQLVIRRIARLEELQQTDVTSSPGSKQRLNDSVLSQLKEMSEVKQVMPLIASVARVTFQNSVSDMAVYGVTSDYLRQSAIKPTSGDIFESNDIAVDTSTIPAVAGITTEDGQTPEVGKIRGQVEFSIDEEIWVRVREQPDRNSKLIGYTKRTEGLKQGNEVWGETYADTKEGSIETTNGDVFGSWIEASFPLWEQKACNSDLAGCADGKYMIQKDEYGLQAYKKGYMAMVNVNFKRLFIQDESTLVLGLTTDETASSSAGIVEDGQWVEIASESAATATEKVTTVKLANSAKKQAVVNSAMLQVLGISEGEAVGKTFTASFVIVGDLLEKTDEKVESAPAEYTIVGVVPDEKSPYFYVPFVDIRGLGVANYSQVKVVAKQPSLLHTVRQKIESIGFSTRSVADTVKQIDSLFATLRTVLLVLGMVALAVAALGMFNTLTVSLLERTREVGLMKAMGMKSHEVRELFLTESMVMGFFGGVLGILIGFLAGEAVGLALSVFSLGKGVGYLDVSYLPPTFTAFIFLLSLVVGICTGIYPARRATKISALDALRYE